MQTGEGFVFYVRLFWGMNPDKSAIDMINKALEGIPEPWRNNIPERAIEGLKLLAEDKTSSEALDELATIDKEVNK